MLESMAKAIVEAPREGEGSFDRVWVVIKTSFKQSSPTNICYIDPVVVSNASFDYRLQGIKWNSIRPK